MGRKAKVGTGMRINSLKRKGGLLRAKQKMKEQMDRVWKDFFEKNPNMKEEDVRRRIEERLRSKLNQKGRRKGN
jgi:hypothetical protein